MNRYKLTVEYDGTDYCGWQRQINAPSIQETIENAVSQFCGHKVTLYGAGRTDSGVHARGQVAHLSFEQDWDADTILKATNAYLRDTGIVILKSEKVPLDFDARISATRRHYCYHIINRSQPLTLDARHAWGISRPLDYKVMHEAAQLLIGHHDFTTFRSSHCQAKSPVKTLDQLSVTADGPNIFIRARSRSFLHAQVRSMVGSLRMVGDGRWQPTDLQAALEACDRKACGPVAPPHGLYLMAVDYV